MQLSKLARLAAITLPAALGVAVLVIWYDMNTPPSMSEYVNSVSNTQEVKSFLTVYPTAKAQVRDDFYDCPGLPCPPIPQASLDYSYYERPNEIENTARSVTLLVSFESGTVKPNYFSVSCYDQLREDSGVRIEGFSLSNVTDFLNNEKCPLNLRTID